MAKLYERRVGEIGIPIRVRFLSSYEVPVDVSLADTRTVTVRKPDGTTFGGSASFTTDGTDGYIEILTESGDLSLEGKYRVWAQYTTLSETRISQEFSFFVRQAA